MIFILLIAKKHAPLGLMLAFPILGLIYAAVNKPDGVIFSLVTPLDRAMPFIKGFAIPYSVWIFYIYACLIYFYIKDRNVYYLTLGTYVVSALISYAIYSVFQTTVPRPVVTGDDPLSSLVKFIYSRDQPYNCFPSIHVFSSYLMIKSLIKSGFGNWINRLVIYMFSTLIILSTMFVKQHVILDVVGGIMLAEVVFQVLRRLQRVVLTNRGSEVKRKSVSI